MKTLYTITNRIGSLASDFGWDKTSFESKEAAQLKADDMNYQQQVVGKWQVSEYQVAN